MNRSVLPDWGGIKLAYLKGDMTVGDICRTYDVTTGALYWRIQIENWQLRQSRSSGIYAAPKDIKPARAKPDARLDQTNLYQRFFRVIDRQMVLLEAKLNENAYDISLEQNAASRERDARTLASLVRLLEKLNDLEPENQQQGQERENSAARDEGAAVRLREDLAQRIDKLLQEQQD